MADRLDAEPPVSTSEDMDVTSEGSQLVSTGVHTDVHSLSEYTGGKIRLAYRLVKMLGRTVIWPPYYRHLTIWVLHWRWKRRFPLARRTMDNT